MRGTKSITNLLRVLKIFFAIQIDRAKKITSHFSKERIAISQLIPKFESQILLRQAEAISG